MIDLENTMDGQTFKNFIKGLLTVKRMEKFISGTWTDMIIEQSLMKSMKTEGEVSRGRNSTEQDVDARDSRVKIDNTDVSKLVE
ncbi:uncharacterized protein TNCV_175221 [Trichonephila clavipes]|nr:uncharacterized protein TNCV_175221 [Trichonephila clavipes]